MKPMLIPQFTLRTLLGITAGCAVVFSVLAFAVRGQPWAIGVSVAVGTVVVAMLVYAGLFGVLWLFSLIGAGRAARGRSPFRPAGSSPFRTPAAPTPPEQESPATPILLE
jgi:hypothetical protein